MNMLSALEKIAQIRAAFPKEGLFAEKEWLLSPEPFRITPRLAEQLAKLGHRLNRFNRACNELYQRSIRGQQPAWIADYLDRGKPRDLVEFARRRAFRDDFPRVIRPDLVLTDEGFTIAELDTVPGGIGLTGWLNQTYARFGVYDLLGGADGMITGFRDILGGDAEVLISREAETYRPEMAWLSAQTQGAIRVRAAEDFEPPRERREGAESPLFYRFFEHFDLPNLPNAPAVLGALEEGRMQITPPMKPYLEEKLWFALFWMRPLREYWRRELSERHFFELQKVIPYTWILDPTPLPQHGVIPGLEIHDWAELQNFSQKQRELILKVSGFSELAWGSRSVVLGSDCSQPEWQAALENALGSAAHQPYILQRFHKGRLLEQPYLNPKTNQIEILHGRVRLCPYYFVLAGKTELRGALATVCPADKKLLHGMKDAIMVPTAVQPE